MISMENRVRANKVKLLLIAAMLFVVWAHNGFRLRGMFK